MSIGLLRGGLPQRGLRPAVHPIWWREADDAFKVAEKFVAP
jgi:hypothetical protein